MKFSFQCLAVTHTSGRVTLTPLTLPALAVHAATLEAAKFELTLALDDRISRSHPRHLARFCTPGAGELTQVHVPVLPLFEAKEGTERPPQALVLDALLSEAQAKHTESRLLSTELRSWFKSSGDELTKESIALLEEHFAASSPATLLALRSEGDASLVTLEVEAKPLVLADLRPSELHLDERAPPRGLEDELAAAEEKAERGSDDDSWEGKKEKSKAPKEDRPPATPTLQKLGVKWHELAKEGAFPLTFGRDEFVEQVRAHLAQKLPEPLVLVGPAGVGKTAICYEVVRRLLAATPSGKRVRPVFQLDGSRLIAGDGFFGAWQQQTINAFAEAHEANAVLHLGHVIELIDAGRSAHSDDNVAQLLLPTLAAREVAVVAEATVEEWARLKERNQSFARLFAPLVVTEPPAAEVAGLLSSLARAEGKRRNVVVEEAALDEIRALVKRFRPYGSSVGNSVSFLRRALEAAASPVERTVAAKQARRKPTQLTRLDVLARFSRESGVPEELLREDVPLQVDDVRAFLSARVMGQPDAVARCAQVVSVIKANLADPMRPVATLLFAGPTGVGKTELSKALAERVFGSKDRLLRLDMGEYAGPDALIRLVGDSRSDGFLPTAVRRQPFSVVLLDEIEKAHPVVFDTLLSVLGEGRLTDGRGKLADFRSTVVVMTSNLGASTQRPKVGFSGGDSSTDVRAHYLAEVRRFFRPELFNRLDDVLVFNPLGAAELSHIVQRELAKVAARPGFARLDVNVRVPEDVQQALAEWGFEPKYGARPLKRALERRLVAPAAAHLARHRPSGASRLEVERTGEALDFRLESIGGDEPTLSRADLLQVCNEAAELRAEVRSWLKAPVVSQLRDNVRMFERLSRLPSYWEDRALADEQSRAATFSKDVFDGLEKVRAQAEAAEELAFEAFGLRAAHSEEAIRSGLSSARTAFQPLTERLYASLFPRVEAATLTLVPGRGANDWARWLLDTYASWARSRGLRVEMLFLIAKSQDQIRVEQQQLDKARATPRTSRDEVVRVLQQQSVIQAIKVYRERTGVGLKEAKDAVERIRDSLEAPKVEPSKWELGFPQPHEAVQTQGLALRVYGDSIPMLLSAEHGSHRFHIEGATATVKVRFQTDATKESRLGMPEQLDVSMPSMEVRRVWPTRKGQEYGAVKDLRTGTEHRCQSWGFELGDVLAAWVRHRVFGTADVNG